MSEAGWALCGDAEKCSVFTFKFDQQFLGFGAALVIKI
jgi:hypothetical protein